jgi:RND family efflux transporter MFP subunit
MNRIFPTTLLLWTLILAACGAPTAAPPPASTRQATAATQGGFSQLGDAVTASAEVVPAQHTQMSFVISAPVKEILVKEGQVVKAGQILVTLNVPDLELAVTKAEFDVKSAQLMFQRSNDPYKKVTEDGKTTYVKAYVEKRQEAEAKLNGAKAGLDLAKFTLAQGTLTAPFDGTVVKLDVRVGEVTSPGKVVLVLGDTAHMQIETTDLSERDVRGVRDGQPAAVTIEALNTTITGKVVSVSPISEIVGGDVVYKVKIKLDEQPADLLWGMSAEVQIQTE